MKQWFAIVLLPDNRSVKKINSLMREISKQYKTHVAIRDPKGPHASFIYLHEKLDEKEIEAIIKNLQDKFKKIESFQVIIDGITSFRRKYYGIWGKKRGYKVNWVVYLKVIKSKNLSKLHRITNNRIKNFKNTKFPLFHPHITLARKDINKETFFRILKDYKNLKIHYEFKLTYLAAMIRKNKKQKWRIIKLKLGKNQR